MKRAFGQKLLRAVIDRPTGLEIRRINKPRKLDNGDGLYLIVKKSKRPQGGYKHWLTLIPFWPCLCLFACFWSCAREESELRVPTQWRQVWANPRVCQS
jgi:hypothetical protein